MPLLCSKCNKPMTVLCPANGKGVLHCEKCDTSTSEHVRLCLLAIRDHLKSDIPHRETAKEMFRAGASVPSVELALINKESPLFTKRMLYDANYRVHISMRAHPSDMEACRRLAQK